MSILTVAAKNHAGGERNHHYYEKKCREPRPLWFKWTLLETKSMVQERILSTWLKLSQTLWIPNPSMPEGRHISAAQTSIKHPKAGTSEKEKLSTPIQLITIMNINYILFYF